MFWYIIKEFDLKKKVLQVAVGKHECKKKDNTVVSKVSSVVDKTVV